LIVFKSLGSHFVLYLRFLHSYNLISIIKIPQSKYDTNILIVEDDPNLSKNIRDALVDENYSVEVVAFIA